MSSEDEVSEQLDTELNRYIVAMKPYVLKLQDSSERRVCALWIKKLCRPSGAGVGVEGRKNRNSYAKLLLHMLKRGVLEGPFAQKPEQGLLKSLPSYMTTFVEELSSAGAPINSSGCLPEWILGELEDTEAKEESSVSTAQGETPSEKPSDIFHSGVYLQRTGENDLGTSPSDDHHNKTVSLDDNNLEARLNSWNLGVENPRYLRQKPMPRSLVTPKIAPAKRPSLDHQALLRAKEKELEMKVKIAEGKFHEEKVKLQQKHDADVQKILDRKNDEIEALKSTYKKKQKESEDQIRRLEKKVQTLVRESQVVREAKEQQIVELKKMCEQSNDSLNNEWEKRLHDAVAEMEKEKFNIRKKHTEDMQELLEETNARLHKMEEEYLQQTQSTNETVQKLGARVQQLTVEAENSHLLQQKLSQEKMEAEQRYQDLCSELQELKARYNLLQKDKDHIMQEYKENIQRLQSKFDVDRDFIKQEQALSAAKTSGVIEELQRSVTQLKEQLQESEHQRQQQLRDQEYKVQQDKLHWERVYEKQINVIQNDLDKERGDAQRKIRKLEETLKEKEEQLRRVTEVQRLQAQQAGAALEEFKRQVELNSEKDSAEMKQRIVELKLEHEQEKTHLFQQHNAVQDCLVRDHQREIEKLEKQLRAAMAEHESQSQESRKRDGQVICSLENQILRLREELIQANSLRNQQLLDLSRQRDEEKVKAAREKEATVNKMKMETEKMILDLKKKHAAETEKVLNKASSRLKQTEKEYSQRLAKSSQVIAELKTTISSLTEENSRQQLVAEQRLQEVVQKLEDEKQQLMTDNDRAIKALQDELESYRSQVYAAERNLQRHELKAQEQLINVREEYEKILKGLIPAASKKELEDTILSLKSQTFTPSNINYGKCCSHKKPCCAFRVSDSRGEVSAETVESL
ncbi:centrosomal protein of 112 kDa isoform X4 [Neopelma chrysocephalum]|uniref:centrosomal protein of 112 kDa isoform X4 n=1 Tax=Neopelma chrysocephalum TaxID=114329 RepID=UPI000FCD28D1|nr:centrosomal protein of 112 kDa isoform X4 [Neopelma chrysocephalum]